MFGVQRLQKIRETILEQEIIDVPSLSEMLGVSEVTVRRDLDKLEKEGFITKTYGGAILNKETRPGRIVVPKESTEENEEEIKLISDIALQMIKSDEAIFLGGGPISRNIAKNLTDRKKLIVVTNDIFVAAQLNFNPDVKVIVTGGDLVSSRGIMVGPRVVSTLKDMFVSRAFVDIRGVDSKFGYTMESYDEVVILKEIIDISKETVALADVGKFDTVSYSRLGDLNLFKKVISSKDVPEDYKKYYFDNIIKLYTTYDVI